MPVPRVLRSSENSNRRKQHSQVFTLTPNKEELERKENAKQSKERVNKAKTVKRNLDEDSKENENRNSKKKATKVKEIATDPCIVCEEFGKDNEWWVTCVCGKSSHAECAGVEPNQIYICHFCEA